MSLDIFTEFGVIPRNSSDRNNYPPQTALSAVFIRERLLRSSKL
jgi:hypothetical protein